MMRLSYRWLAIAMMVVPLNDADADSITLVAGDSNGVLEGL